MLVLDPFLINFPEVEGLVWENSFGRIRRGCPTGPMIGFFSGDDVFVA